MKNHWLEHKIQKGVENADFKGTMLRCYECQQPCWRWCDHCLQPCCKKHRQPQDYPYMCDECYEKVIEESRKENEDDEDDDITAAWGARPSQ